MKKEKREVDYFSTKMDLLVAINNMNWTDNLKESVIKEIWGRI